ncbi:polyisoprenoid-binding protein [Flavobacterium cupreum]|uniref:Polyisoprenoid-binding protein n=2 Tax=Flavobacterium TaxID=237 RepID=A0A4Y7UG08_9FLAO|nr:MULTISPECIES: YceI family protein [Flavobacterium]RUT67910.1 polyisoprenoid-binding protein [Flavobacterium cupreum]TCN59491.1 polyisoprenoid-binding protein YceI [Flavobacterium circumlabens]TEB44789.1 polyisoprenoid-binding protein [Flavobacterium circumlabens]
MTAIRNSKWAVDQGHSEIQFKVKHLAISNVSGIFKTFNGTFQTENEDFTDAEIQFEVDTNSIDTNNSDRDGHLKSPLFLDSEKYPKIKFVGYFRNQNGNKFIEGDLTILETTKNIKMEAEHTGIGTGRFNDIRAGFEISGKINRKDFGLTFHLLNDAGNLVVGEDVKLHFDIQLIKQAE